MITLLWKLHRWFLRLESFQIVVLFLLLFILLFVCLSFLKLESWLNLLYLQGRK